MGKTHVVFKKAKRESQAMEERFSPYQALLSRKSVKKERRTKENCRILQVFFIRDKKII